MGKEGHRTKARGRGRERDLCEKDNTENRQNFSFFVPFPQVPVPRVLPGLGGSYGWGPAGYVSELCHSEQRLCAASLAPKRKFV